MNVLAFVAAARGARQDCQEFPPWESGASHKTRRLHPIVAHSTPSAPPATTHASTAAADEPASLPLSAKPPPPRRSGDLVAPPLRVPAAVSLGPAPTGWLPPTTTAMAAEALAADRGDAAAVEANLWALATLSDVEAKVRQLPRLPRLSRTADTSHRPDNPRRPIALYRATCRPPLLLLHCPPPQPPGSQPTVSAVLVRQCCTEGLLPSQLWLPWTHPLFCLPRPKFAHLLITALVISVSLLHHRLHSHPTRL